MMDVIFNHCYIFDVCLYLPVVGDCVGVCNSLFNNGSYPLEDIFYQNKILINCSNMSQTNQNIFIFSIDSNAKRDQLRTVSEFVQVRVGTYVKKQTQCCLYMWPYIAQHIYIMF
jgi:hypothetical protein